MTTTSPAGPAPAREASGGYAALDASVAAKAAAAGGDLLAGLRRYRSARYLALETMKNQYRRTVLGPWWVTLQSGMYVAGLALIFGQLLNAPTETFLPYVTTGYLYFLLLLGIVRAGSMVFVNGSGVIRSTRQPLSGLVLRDVTVEFLQFGHNILILLLLYPFGLLHITWHLLLVPLMLAVTVVNALAIGFWLGPLVARYRDVGPAVMSILQVAIFFSPVFYRSRGLTGAAALLIQLNPLAYFLDTFRPLLLSELPRTSDLVVLAGITVVNVIVGAITFTATRSRIPYWVA